MHKPGGWPYTPGPSPPPIIKAIITEGRHPGTQQMAASTLPFHRHLLPNRKPTLSPHKWPSLPDSLISYAGRGQWSDSRFSRDLHHPATTDWFYTNLPGTTQLMGPGCWVMHIWDIKNTCLIRSIDSKDGRNIGDIDLQLATTATMWKEELLRGLKLAGRKVGMK